MKTLKEALLTVQGFNSPSRVAATFVLGMNTPEEGFAELAKSPDGARSIRSLISSLVYALWSTAEYRVFQLEDISKAEALAQVIDDLDAWQVALPFRVPFCEDDYKNILTPEDYFDWFHDKQRAKYLAKSRK